MHVVHGLLLMACSNSTSKFRSRVLLSVAGLMEVICTGSATISLPANWIAWTPSNSTLGDTQFTQAKCPMYESNVNTAMKINVAPARRLPRVNIHHNGDERWRFKATVVVIKPPLPSRRCDTLLRFLRCLGHTSWQFPLPSKHPHRLP